MEADSGPSAPGPRDSSPVSRQKFETDSTPLRSRRRHLVLFLIAFTGLSFSGCGPTRLVDTLTRIQASGKLVYGSDKEGGGPYIFPNPEAPREVVGFEVDLMRELAKGLGVEPVFSQGQWDRLLQGLDAGRVDLVVNGYEWTENRARTHGSSRPYYIYQLQLITPKAGPLRAWDDLKSKRAPQGRAWRVGVLVQSAADTFAAGQRGANVEVVRFDGATDAMTAVANGQIDATLQDLPAALFYRDRFPTLTLAGPPVGRGYYVIYVRKGDDRLREAIDLGLGRLIASGKLRAIYERYGVWNEAQEGLDSIPAADLRIGADAGPKGWSLVLRYGPLLVDAAEITVILSVAAMPLAMAIGLAVALGRLYAPRPIQLMLGIYVEILRGTPLMLQLYVLYFLLKLPPWVAGIGGLAVNYSAYEAEIYRAGLQAIPRGQMEAALALGMTRGQALRRVIVPQAVRIVIPPVTNDFIALFKDTSVCSVITLVELTKQYSILANNTGGVVEFAMATAALYMAMSVPLSWFSRWSERRLDGLSTRGGGAA